jgi:hypothetical protein
VSGLDETAPSPGDHEWRGPHLVGRRSLTQVLLGSAYSSGGVPGKMISPENLASGAAAAGLAGKEGDIFRRVLPAMLDWIVGSK